MSNLTHLTHAEQRYNDGVRDGIDMAARMLERMGQDRPAADGGGDKFARGIVATVAAQIAPAVRSLGAHLAKAQP